MSTQDHEATARRLIPAGLNTKMKIDEARSAVAAALAEQANHYLIIIGDYEMWRKNHLAEIAELRAEANLNLESANSMKAAWNACCEDVTQLRAKLAEAERESHHWEDMYQTAVKDCIKLKAIASRRNRVDQ